LYFVSLSFSTPRKTLVYIMSLVRVNAGRLLGKMDSNHTSLK
jgi:hypothetical protein